LLEVICKECYGEEELEEGFYEYTWAGQKSMIKLEYDWAEEDGCLAVASIIIRLEKLAAQKKKEAEKAAGDW